MQSSVLCSGAGSGLWGVTLGSEGVRGVPSNYGGWMIQLWSKKIRSHRILSFVLHQGDLGLQTGYHLYFLIYPVVSVSSEMRSTPSVAGGGWCGVMSSLSLVTAIISQSEARTEISWPMRGRGGDHQPVPNNNSYIDVTHLRIINKGNTSHFRHHLPPQDVKQDIVRQLLNLNENVFSIFSKYFSVDVSSEFKFESRKIWWKIVFLEVSFQHILRTLETGRRLNKRNVNIKLNKYETFKS